MDIGREEKIDVDESEWFSDVHLTLFTELFLDESKMKVTKKIPTDFCPTSLKMQM